MKKGRTSEEQRKKAIIATIITEIIFAVVFIAIFALTGHMFPLLPLVLLLVMYVTAIVLYSMVFNYIFKVSEYEYQEEMERCWKIVREHLKDDDYVELKKNTELDPDAPMQRAILYEGEKNIKYYAKMEGDSKARMILVSSDDRIVYSTTITNPYFILRQFDFK